METEYAKGIADGHLKGRGSAIGSCCDFLAAGIAADLDELEKLRSTVAGLEEELAAARSVGTVQYRDDQSGERYRTLLAAAVESSGVDAALVDVLVTEDGLRFVCTAKSAVCEHALARAVGEYILRLGQGQVLPSKAAELAESEGQ